MLTFTPENYAAPQTVNVAGADDALQDGTVAYEVRFASVNSTDPNYAGAALPPAVALTNRDNDSAAILVSDLSGPTFENGGQATFEVRLQTEPTADVTLTFASDDTSEGLPSSSSLVFTPANWDAPQVVAVTGMNDDVQDGNMVYHIVFDAAVSADPVYQGLVAPSVELTNIDDETAGVTINVTNDTSREDGTQASFDVVLNSEPTADVTITLSSDDATEGVAAPASLTFTTANWNARQTVLVAGQNDSVADGNQLYQITFDPIASADSNYVAVVIPSLDLVNLDDETPGLVIQTLDDASAEDGDAASFEVSLQSEPTADVVVTFATTDATEGVSLLGELTFTALNWNAPQTVTVIGQDDAVADGNQDYAVEFLSVTSSDENYATLALPTSVELRNLDNDSPGILVSPITGDTGEDGSQATFAVVLQSEPTENVIINFGSDDTTEGTLTDMTLVFTPVNWNAPQFVTVTGANDDIADGNQPYRIVFGTTVSGDAGYDGITPLSVDVINVDDDSAGISVTGIEGDTDEGGASTSFTLVLNSEPTADVTVNFASADATEGVTATTSVTFTALNWSAPQSVLVTGVNDNVADGNQLYQIVFSGVTSADPNYAAIALANIDVLNVDDDSAGITVSAISGDTTEAGGSATFSVVLTSEPTADVTVQFATDDASEGVSTATSLTFTALNWNAPQTVTVTGQNDDLADGNQPYQIDFVASTSADLAYAGITPSSVDVVTVDNDSAGIVVSPVSGDTTEAGGQANFTVVLTSEPFSDVTVNFATNDASEGVTANTSLTFTAANWAAPQTVFITGQNDNVADGNQPYQIVFGATTSADLAYAGITPNNRSVTNLDDDSAGIVVVPVAGPTGEDGTSQQFSVVLTSEPTADVEISFVSDDVSEGTLSTGTLTFTAANWASPQLVNVAGANDNVADGDQPYQIDFAAPASADPAYAALAIASIDVVNLDDDSAGILVSAISGNTTEAGGTATFSVVLQSEPTANVVVSLDTDDATEGVVNTTSLTFTALNWNAPQVVTVTGQNDAVSDGNQPYQIDFSASASADPQYNALVQASVDVTNVDNDSAGVQVSVVTGQATEAGGQASFSIVLTSEPFATVTVNFASDDVGEGQTNVTSRTFTTANWNTPQTVTVTGQNDNVADGNRPFQIDFGAVTSADTAYAAIVVPSLNLTNTDNDSAGITVSTISGSTTEAGGQASFTIVLNSEPFEDVTVNFASDDTGEGTTNGTSRTFTFANWNVPQTVTVTGVNDNIADGNQPYQIDFAATTSNDAAYAALTPSSVSVTNNDNDAAGISVSSISGNTTEAGGTATFTVVLLSEPTANVVVAYSSINTNEGTVAPPSLTFTSANWSTPRTVTVTGVDDATDDGDVSYDIMFAPSTSSDPAYQNIVPSPLNLLNLDDEATCGDGNTEGAEQCDDGNTQNLDGCSDTCQVEVCGDNIVQGGPIASVEFRWLVTSCTSPRPIEFSTESRVLHTALSPNNCTCSPGISSSTTTDPLVFAALKGEHTIRFTHSQYSAWAGIVVNFTSGEQRLVPIFDRTNGGVFTDSYLCNGYTIPTDVSTTVNAVGEECDDGNAVNGDGCETTCIATPICGDGIVSGTEACDDGNVVSTDGCSAVCAVEICGDNIVTPSAVTSAEIVWSSTSCAGPQAATVLIDGTPIYSAQLLETCDCGPSERRHTITDPGVLALMAGTHDWEVQLAASGGSYLAWLGVNLVGPTGTTALSLYDFAGGGDTFVEPDPCNAGFTDGASALVSHTTSGETCDDGNTANGDGCSATCTVEVAGTVVCAEATEGNTLNLSCPSGVVQSIEFASYGTPTGTCGSYAISGCHAGGSVAAVNSLCGSMMSCAVPANNAVFGDPCVGTGKRLYVQARCN